MTLIRIMLAICLIPGASAVWAAALKVSESEIQYGKLKEGPPVVKKVVLSNSSAEKVVIANVKASCACITTTLGQRSLNPGENTELEIKYRTFKYAGKFDKLITIFTGPEGKEGTIIRLRGIVDPIPMGKLEMVPRKTMVGDIETGQENKVDIVLKNIGDAPLTVKKVVSRKFKAVYFDGSKSGNVVIEAGKTHKVSFKITPTKSGRFIDIILIYSDARNDIGKGYKGVLVGQAK